MSYCMLQPHLLLFLIMFYFLQFGVFQFFKHIMNFQASIYVCGLFCLKCLSFLLCYKMSTFWSTEAHNICLGNVCGMNELLLHPHNELSTPFSVLRTFCIMLPIYFSLYLRFFFFHNHIKLIILMVLIQVEVLMVTPHKISCLLISVKKREKPTRLFHPLSQRKFTMGHLPK